MKDYSIILITSERTTPVKSKKAKIGVEFFIEENIDQLFGRIENKLKRELYPTDYLIIRKNTITK